MTPQEFKAWFDGFTEAVDEKPTQKQWDRIKERVAEIDGKPVTERVYVDRYLPSYPIYAQPYRPPYYWHNGLPYVTCNTNLTGCSTDKPNMGIGVSGVGDQNLAQAYAALAQAKTGYAIVHERFDSLSAMNALGHADAASLNS